MTIEPAQAVKISLRIDGPLHAALRQEAGAKGREIGEHIQRILAEYAIRERLLDEAKSKEYLMMWSLVQRAVEMARKICREGRFVPEIADVATHECMADARWAGDYEAHVQDNPYKHGNPRKGPINKEIGLRIKEGIGGRVRRTSDGKPEKKPIAGSIIQSCTLMESFDPEAVR